MDLGLKNKVALVAGASMGIGYGIAEALSAEGARVALCSRDEGRAREAARRIREKTGSPALGLAIDVLDPDAGRRFVEEARKEFGAPQILVTNAGGSPPGPGTEVEVEDIEAALQLNYLSAARLTKAVLPDMRKARWGRILHITSTTVFEPKVALFLSSAVRPALVGFAKALALEVAGEGITSNVLAPGLIDTERLSELIEYMAKEQGRSPEAQKQAMAASVPAGRLADPLELGRVAAFLCSEPAAYLTGVTLRVDGGRVAYLL